MRLVENENHFNTCFQYLYHISNRKHLDTRIRFYYEIANHDAITR